MPVVIVAIPEAQDRVHKISSEKVAHLTMMYLGEDIPADKLQRIVLFVEHVASQVQRFGLTVDRRGELGDKKADVLFFEKKGYVKELKDTLANLLTNRDIYEAFTSTEQFPEWTPHLTLGFPETPAKEMDEDHSFYYISFDRIAVWTGDYDGPEFRLKGWEDMAEAAWSSMHRDAGAAAIDRALAHMRPGEAFEESKVKRDGRGRFSNVSSKKVKTLDELAEEQKQALLDKYGEALFESSSLDDYLANLPEGQDPEGTRTQLELDLRTMEAEYKATEANLGSTYVGPEYKPKKKYKAPTNFDFGHAMPLEQVLAAMQEVEDGDALQFGIKGMKWGVRRSKEELARANADPDAVKAVETQAKIKSAGSLSVVSSKDLQQLVDRINLEDKYVKATLASSPTTKKGGGILRKILKNEIDYALRKDEGPILSAFKAAKAARAKKLAAATAAANAAAAARRTRASNPVSPTGPAARRTQRAQQVYNVTTLGQQGNPLRTTVPARTRP